TKNASYGHSYRSVLQALQAAKPGDVIQLMDTEHFENLLIELRTTDITTDVTIQAAPGKEVVWKSYRKEEAVPILTLQHARHFKSTGKGMTVDGEIYDNRGVAGLIVVH